MAGQITTVARPYAEAVFARATETDRLEAWSEALAGLARVAAEPSMAAQLKNPQAPRERLRDLLFEVAGEALFEEARNLVRLLADNGRLTVLEEIHRLFEIFRIQRRGVRQVHIRSAYAIDEAERETLAAALRHRLNAEIELSVEEDPALIGGIEVRADDLVIDASVRGNLRKLASELRI